MAIGPFSRFKEFYKIMKRFTLLTISVLFAALFAVSTFAQAGAVPAASKIGWLDTGAFGDEKEGVTRYIAGLKALDAEMKPRVTELQTLQTRLKTISYSFFLKSNSRCSRWPSSCFACAAF